MKITRRRLLLVLVLCAVLGVSVFSALQAYRGASAAPGLVNPRRITFTAQDSRFEDITFRTADNLELSGWYRPPRNGAVVILVHGVNNNRSAVLPIAEVLVEQGYGALLFDVRAQGNSQGERLDHVEQDGLAAVAYVQSRDPDARIGLYGFSLGSVIAFHTAAVTPEVLAVMVDGAGSSRLEDVPLRDVYDWTHWPYAWGFFTNMSRIAPDFAPRPTRDSIALIAPRPMLLVASDTRGERSRAQRFLDAAGDSAELWHIPGAGHGEGYALDPLAYRERLLTFFDRHLLTGAAS
jgi:uncharacterized protein